MCRQEDPCWDLATPRGDVRESTGDEFSRWSIEVVNPHSGPVLAIIAELV